MTSRTWTSSPVSSASSRATPSVKVSPSSSMPPGIDHWPSRGGPPRRTRRARSLSITTPPTPTRGCSGYSRLGVIVFLPASLFVRFTLYNTSAVCCLICSKEVFAVVRCPKCATEVDVDEDEVEEGEILACPECETEMEVVQIHPVKVNAISDDEDEDEEDEESENGDEFEEDDEEKGKDKRK